MLGAPCDELCSSAAGHGLVTLQNRKEGVLFAKIEGVEAVKGRAYCQPHGPNVQTGFPRTPLT